MVDHHRATMAWEFSIPRGSKPGPPVTRSWKAAMSSKNSEPLRLISNPCRVVRGALVDRRFEDARLSDASPSWGLVIVVLTQVPSKDGQAHPHAVEDDFITGLGLPIRAGGAPVLTNALADDFTHALAFRTRPFA